MKIVEMSRQETSNENGTFSSIKINKQLFGVTLEPSSRDNKPNESCIPAGQYIAKRVQSPAHGDTFRVQNVVDRSYINFHSGAIKKHTLGCIMLGESVYKLRGARALKNSGKTFKKFMEIMGDDQEFHLTITEDY